MISWIISYRSFPAIHNVGGDSMLCDICHKKEATIYYTEIINGKKREQHFCEECAAKYSSYRSANPVSGEETSADRMIFGLLQELEPQDQEDQTESLVCPNCGLTYEEFSKDGQFGCEQCYFSFQSLLNKNLRSIQGSDTHTGKRPKEYLLEAKRLVNGLSQLDRLSIQLQQAIELEEYEEAAKIRDQIRDLKKSEGIANGKMG